MLTDTTNKMIKFHKDHEILVNLYLLVTLVHMFINDKYAEIVHMFTISAMVAIPLGILVTYYNNNSTKKSNH